MVINLNQRCDVILTTHGAEVYNKYFRKLHATCKLIELTNLKAGDVLSLQLWDLMNIFGKHLYNGAESCFENNDISFNDKVVNVPERSREEIKELLDNWKGTIVEGGDISISPWISVEERLPEMRSNKNPFSELVYVRYVQTISGKNRIFYAFDKLQYICLRSGKIIGHAWWRHQNKYDRVTHWMEIPKIEEDIV